MIPRINLDALRTGDEVALAGMHRAATDIGFATVFNTSLGADQVREVIETYRDFFKLPEADKRPYDMARTGSNRGWGRRDQNR